MKTKLTNRPVEQVIAAINALDLESVKIRAMDPELGEGWTREYTESCERVFGTYLHHNPDIGGRAPAEIERKAALVAKTRRLYQQEFGRSQDCNTAANTAMCGAAIRVEHAAMCGAAIRTGNAAMCGAAIRVNNPARVLSIGA